MTGVQTCALPISGATLELEFQKIFERPIGPSEWDATSLPGVPNGPGRPRPASRRPTKPIKPPGWPIGLRRIVDSENMVVGRAFSEPGGRIDENVSSRARRTREIS